jgi:hypothetical protein
MKLVGCRVKAAGPTFVAYPTFVFDPFFLLTATVLSVYFALARTAPTMLSVQLERMRAEVTGFFFSPASRAPDRHSNSFQNDRNAKKRAGALLQTPTLS